MGLLPARASADTNLGRAYAYGEGVPQDPEQAAEFIMSAFGQAHEYTRSTLVEDRGADLPDSTRRAIQTWLQDRGFYSGAIDGDFGRSTIAALKTYARSAGDPQD